MAKRHLRIVAGEYRSRRIEAPQGRQTRPTADRVREAIFSIIGPVEGLRVLDLFAGSGALGIEALSRGAASATFVDADHAAVGAVRHNLAKLGAEGEVVASGAEEFLRTRPAPFDRVFVDPPYSAADGLAGQLTKLLPAVLRPDGLIVVESDKRTPLALDLPLERERVYGRVRIAIHRGS